MIGYAGYFGSGKTLNMTKDLYDAHKQGAFVITNYTTTFSNLIVQSQMDIIHLLEEILALRQNGKILGDLLPDSAQDYKKIYLAIDEAGIYFNARNWKEWREFPHIMDFLLQCRKLDVEIFYTVQHPTFVDANFRRVTTDWCVFSKIPIIPFTRKEIMIIPPDNPNYSVADIQFKRWIWGGKSKVWNMYDTTELCMKISKNLDDHNYQKLLSSKYVTKTYLRNRVLTRWQRFKEILNTPVSVLYKKLSLFKYGKEIQKLESDAIDKTIAQNAVDKERFKNHVSVYNLIKKGEKNLDKFTVELNKYKNYT
ncbi:hypothetical protein CSB37_02960 [bacterium DOLZORAL124_38_8]|nr:MAG: hypothetical protein CSB37_02960 [bacterium DOLZORAL124_38_8]